MKARTLTETAIGALLICVCSWITIPFAIPFTLQTFAVFCVLVVCSGKVGLMSIGLYILLGAVGLPVFSGFQGGPAHLFGYTGGFIFGFLLTGLCFALAEPYARRGKLNCGCVLGLGLLLCYTAGSLWFMLVGGTGRTFFGVLSVCVLPFIIPDTVKLVLALLLGERIRAALKRP